MCIKELTAGPSSADNVLQRSKSYPNLCMKAPVAWIPVAEEKIRHKESVEIVEQKPVEPEIVPPAEEPEEIECAISGRLEIRLTAKEPIEVNPKEISPAPEESVYFDAITNGGTGKSMELSSSTRNKYHEVKQFFEDNFAPLPPPPPKPKALEERLGAIAKIIREPTADDKENVLCDIKDDLLLLTNSDNTKKPHNINLFPNNIKASNCSDKFDKAKTECCEEEGMVLKQAAIIEKGPPSDVNEGVVSSQVVMMQLKKDLHSGSFSGSSRIPILSSNLRLSKCASWAGGDNAAHPDLNDLTPGTVFEYFNQTYLDEFSYSFKKTSLAKS